MGSTSHCRMPFFHITTILMLCVTCVASRTTLTGFTVARHGILTSRTTIPATTRLWSSQAIHERISRQDRSMEQRVIGSHLDLVLSHLTSRRASTETMEAAKTINSLQEQRVLLIKEKDKQLNIRKETSAAVGLLIRENPESPEIHVLKEEANQAGELADTAEQELQQIEDTCHALLAGIPNLLDDIVPDGRDDKDNVEVARWGNIENLPTELGWTGTFQPKWHDDVALAVGGYQAEAAVKMSGARFVALSGDVARLERAIGCFFMDRHVNAGYTEVSVPLVVGRSALEGTSQLPKFKEDLFAISPDSHTCNGEDAYLIPTAEVPVTNMHRDQVLDEADLPKRYVAWTPCFRAEAGSYGRDTKGLIRTHQFGKVELVKITSANTSNAEHEALTEDAEACLQALKLPYRKVRLCSGDIGFSARHCYDLEVWLPGAAEYREISSCSNTGDFQARRMGLRYRPATTEVDGSKKSKKVKPQFCHTINGSGLAVGRTLVAVLENYQMPDGSVVVPDVLRPYMGGKLVIPAQP